MSAFLFPFAPSSRTPRALVRPASAPRQPSLHLRLTSSRCHKTPSAKVDRVSSNQKIENSPQPSRPIPIDFAALSHSVASLNIVAVPARVENVYQVDASTLMLALRTLSGQSRLTLSFSQSVGRLTVVSAASGSRNSSRSRDRSNYLPNQYALGATAKSILQGTALVSASIAAPFERIARLDFAPSPTEPPCAHIYHELLGNGRSNLVLTDAKQSIKACGRQVAGRNAGRALQTGLVWQPPAPPSGAHPSDRTVRETLERIANDDGSARLGKTLVRYISGVSPAAAFQVCDVANTKLNGIHIDATLDEVRCLGGEWSLVLSQSLSAWFHALGNLQLMRVRGVFHSGRLRKYEMKLVNAEDEAQSRGVSLEQLALADGGLIEEYYGSFETAAEIAEKHGKLKRRLAFLLKRAQSRVETCISKVDECETVATLKRDAEFLFAYAHSWSPGDVSVRGEWPVDVPDLESTEQHGSLRPYEVFLPDTPESSPIECGKDMYRKAGKLERAEGIAKARLSDAQEEVDWFESAVVHLDMCRTPEHLHILEEEIEKMGDSRRSVDGRNRTDGKSMRSKRGKGRPSPQQKKKGSNPARKQTSTIQGVLRISIPGEHENAELLIGRNASGNESVTFSLARKRDVWLHAAGTAGSHVVVRGCNGETFTLQDDDILQKAANFAAFFSKGRHATNVPVSVLYAGDVRKGPGSPRRLGSVLMMANEQRTIYGIPRQVEEAATAALDHD